MGKLNGKTSLIIKFAGSHMLVRVAGENLASSAPESASERCEQCALGLQKLASNRQLARQSEIDHPQVLTRNLRCSPPIIQNLREIGDRI